MDAAMFETQKEPKVFISHSFTPYMDCKLFYIFVKEL